jgi:hypothetical protein
MGKTSDIRAAVEAELKFDPRVNDADIHVANLNGDVALNGTVPGYPQYLEAASATQRVSGVKNVFNHLQVVLPDADFRDDTMLTTAANNALAQNVTVPDGVEATAEDGNLTLTGTVSYALERTAAEQAVASLAGVRSGTDTDRSDRNTCSPKKSWNARPTGVFRNATPPEWPGVCQEYSCSSENSASARKNGGSSPRS